MSIIELKVPAIGESVTEVTLSKWLKPNNSFVRLDEPICEFESDKATLEFPAENSGLLIHEANEGDDLVIGAVIARLDTSHQPEAPIIPITKEEIPEKEIKSGPKSYPSPAASKILDEAGIHPSEIKGSGKDGRITKPDALSAIEQNKSVSQLNLKVSDATTENLTKTPGTGYSRSTRREKLSRMRRTIAKRLVDVKNQTAMLTTFNEADMTEVIRLRKEYNEAYEKKYGIKIGFMSLFSRACCLALKELPEVNAHIDGEDLIYHDFVDISIAISTPTGLVVPPIRNAESLRIHEFEHQLKILAEKARNGSLSLDEMTGGTFTITNGGIFGSLMSTPILNEPQSAILGLHAIKERPVAVNGNIEIRPMMYLALSYDHRVIDGSSSVRFLVHVKELIEDPKKLFLEL